MIVKRFEVWCDDIRHVPCGQELLAVTSKWRARMALRADGWTHTNGMDFCPTCSKRRAQAAAQLAAQGQV